jgi:magnesium transporter
MRVLRLESGHVLEGGRELVRPGAPLWIDLAPTPENITFAGETFHFHPLALEDCAHEGQRPKFEQYPGSLFSVVHRLAPTPDDASLLSLEIDAFLTQDALVTFHSAPIAEVDRVFQRAADEPELLARGPDFILYLLHDALTDVHFALVDALTADIEEIAEEVAASDAGTDGHELLDRIVSLRRTHAILRRRLSPQREVFAALARPGQAIVNDQTAIYFRDVVDHSVRLTEEIDMGRDLLASGMDAYLSRSNNRMSAVTARLTLIATIFLPLNFIAGFFGMNFDILHPSAAVPLVLVAMVAMPVAMYWTFRRKRWL